MEESNEEITEKIWNPAAAVNWSLLLTPAFGPVLHYMNWKSLGEKENEKSALIWAVIFCFLVGVSFIDLTGRAGNNAFFLAFVLLFVWYFARGRKQIRYVEEKFGKTYPKKEWFEPIAVALTIMVGASFVPI